MLRVTIVYRDNSTAVQFDATEAMDQRSRYPRGDYQCPPASLICRTSVCFTLHLATYFATTLRPRLTYFPNGAYVNSNVPVGWPDLTIIANDGRVLFVELKIHPNKPSKEQLHYLSVLPNAHLCYDLNAFKYIVSNFLNFV